MKNKLLTILAVGTLAASPAATAVTVTWTDWTSISTESAIGNIGGVTVTATTHNESIMNGPSQIACGTNYWTQPNPANPAYTGGSVSNAPTACEQVGLNNSVSIIVSFSSPVNGLYMALLSVGQPSYTVTYEFDQSFVIDSEGQGYWGNDVTNGILGAGNTLAMQEFHGVLLFSAPVTSLTFSTAPGENWHAFTFGTATSVPEPGTLALLGLGLAGLGFSRRRKLN